MSHVGILTLASGIEAIRFKSGGSLMRLCMCFLYWSFHKFIVVRFVYVLTLCSVSADGTGRAQAYGETEINLRPLGDGTLYQNEAFISSVQDTASAGLKN